MGLRMDSPNDKCYNLVGLIIWRGGRAMALVERQSVTRTVKDLHRLWMSDETWNELEKSFRCRLILLLVYLAQRGYGMVRVAEGRRTAAAQERLYGVGRSQNEMKLAGLDPQYAGGPGPKVTWCLPLQSKHVHGMAADLDVWDYDSGIWAAVREGAAITGLTWGGAWKVRDCRHVEL